MKKILAMLMAAIMTTGLLAGCGEKPAEGGAPAAGGDNVIKIGVCEPASGDNGAGGKQEVLGIQYANSLTPTVDIGGTTYTIQLEIVDNQSATDKAVSAAQSLVSKGVSVVLGSYGSGVSMAISDILAEAKIPAIGVSCTNPQVTEGKPFYFRVCFLDPFQGTVMANFAKEEFNAKTAYVLTQLGDDYSVGLGNYFGKAFEALGGTVIAETFTEGSSDFSAYMTSAKKAGADVIFAPSATTCASLIIGQAAAAGMTMPILAGDTWESSVILDAQNGKGIPVYCSTFFDENDEAGTAAAFVKGFKEWLNADKANLTANGGNDIVAAVSALGYDAYNTAVAGIVAAQSTVGEDIQKALGGVSVPDAVTGSITFNEEGDANKDMAYIKQAVDGSFKFIKTQAVADIG
ncbi:MAG: ABC transporter substrate-binding protein [Oscillospiraceae bacterium]